MVKNPSRLLKLLVVSCGFAVTQKCYLFEGVADAKMHMNGSVYVIHITLMVIRNPGRLAKHVKNFGGQDMNIKNILKTLSQDF